VRACGGRCCTPGCPAEGKLEQGHITRHADGGQLVFENLIPLCKSCNGKYKGGFTPDTRQAGWRTAFWTLLLVENQIQIRCKHLNRGVNTFDVQQAIDSNGFIDLRAVEFVAKIHYTTHNVHTPKQLAAADARALMWKLYDRGRNCPTPPSRPFRKRQDELMRIAIQIGAENFMLAGAEFLHQQPWVRDDGSRKDDCWAEMCDSFDNLLSDARARAARLAADEKRQREINRKLAEESVIATRDARWRDYVRTADIPDWNGMPDGDKEIIATVAAEKAAASEPQYVSDERLEWSLAAYRRWKFYLTDDLRAARKEVEHKLAQCAKWALRFNDESRREYADQIKNLKEWFAGFKDAATIRDDMWTVNELYNSLDPDRPPGADVQDFLDENNF
jgi:hypothetical protein